MGDGVFFSGLLETFVGGVSTIFFTIMAHTQPTTTALLAMVYNSIALIASRYYVDNARPLQQHQTKINIIATLRRSHDLCAAGKLCSASCGGEIYIYIVPTQGHPPTTT